MSVDSQAAARSLLEVLFPPNSPGLIELRIIVDKRGGELVDRRWYEGVDALVEDLPRLNTLSEQRRAGVFFGVLPRRERGKGYKSAVLPGRVAWADLDFKDYARGEAEAREVLDGFPLLPSILVRSGHGLHAYFLLDRETEPAEIERVSRAFVKALGADHAFDASRILRLPGTLNFKEPDDPVLVEVEALHAERTYELEQLEAALKDAVRPTSSDAAPVEELGDLEIADALPARVQAILDAKSRIRGLFHGTGKPLVGHDGMMDLSSSGYDFSLLLALLRAGVEDPNDLATTLAMRPDGAAKAKGTKYISHTVSNAVARFQRIREERGRTSGEELRIDEIRIYRATPAIYEFQVGEVSFRVSSRELRSKAQFETRYLDALHRLPALPANTEDYRELVTEWLQSAEVLDMPEEANEEFVAREAVEHGIRDLPASEDPEDLDRGKCYLLEDGRRAFKPKSLHRRLQEEGCRLGHHQICRVLRGLGYEPTHFRVEGTVFRVWLAKSL